MAIWFAGAAAAAGQPVFAPGETALLPWPGMAADLRVYVPSDYDAARPTPVVFDFHGTGGRPDVSLKRATGGKGFVFVGMTYAKGKIGGSLHGQKEALALWGVCREVRDKLSGSLNVDKQRCYVSGFSKGGWTASLIFEAGERDCAGAIVLGAGRGMRHDGIKTRGTPKPRPVYIGIGEMDFNLAASRSALQKFPRLNAQVSMEVWEGAGHTRRFTPGMLAWFDVELRRNNEGFTDSMNAWFDGAMKAVDETANPIGRYLAIKRLQLDPRIFHVSKENAARLKSAMNQVRRERAVVIEMQVERRFNAIANREVTGRDRQSLTPKAWERIIADYEKLAADKPDSHFGQKAERSAERVSKWYEYSRRLHEQRETGG